MELKKGATQILVPQGMKGPFEIKRYQCILENLKIGKISDPLLIY